MERTIGLNDILDVRNSCYQEEQQNRQSPYYIVSRGLLARARDDGSGRIEYGYLDVLPPFQRKKLLAIIDESIETNGTAEILDIGAGRGQFLLDCKRRWGDRVNCTGVTAHPYHLGTTEELLKENDIQILQGDVQNLNQILEKETYDVAVSVFTAIHLADPMAMLEGMYFALKYNGIALIHDFPSYHIDESELFIIYMKMHYGMEIANNGPYPGRGDDIAFQKETQSLEVPVRPYLHTSLRDIYYRFKQDAFDSFCTQVTQENTPQFAEKPTI